MTKMLSRSTSLDSEDVRWPNTPFYIAPCIVHTVASHQPAVEAQVWSAQISEALLEAEASRLRRAIRRTWNKFQGALAQTDKAYIRKLHISAKAHSGECSRERLAKLYTRHQHYFKNGMEIDPLKISPALILVEPRTNWEDLFRLSRAYWSIPYSRGYGRRLRFVVFDEYHEAVIGVIGLQSPPADLACRDDLFEYPAGRKLELVNCMMDAYTIGAVPPYSGLLGGKLVAGLVAAEAIRQAYWRTYAGRKTLMQGKNLAQPLLAVTTASAFGRSSIYNRLRFRDRLLAEPIGYTKGFGTIHLEKLYPRIAGWLQARGEFISGGFGHGPKVRWQNIQTALHRLGLPDKYLEHGLCREVFLIRHVSNLQNVITASALPQQISFQANEYSAYWKERWALPRAHSRQDWRSQDGPSSILKAIKTLS